MWKKNLKSFKSITFPVTVICLSSHHFVPRKMRFVLSPKAFRMVSHLGIAKTNKVGQNFKPDPRLEQTNRLPFVKTLFAVNSVLM